MFVVCPVALLTIVTGEQVVGIIPSASFAGELGVFIG